MKQSHSLKPATSSWTTAKGKGYRYRSGKHGLVVAREYSFLGQKVRSGRGMEHIHDHDAAARFIKHEIADRERGLKLGPDSTLLIPVAQEWAAKQKDQRLAHNVKYLETYVGNEAVTLQDASDWRWLARFIDAYADGRCSLNGKPPHQNSVKKCFDAMRRLFSYALIYHPQAVQVNPAEQMPRELRPKGGKATIKHTLLRDVAEIEKMIALAEEHYPKHAPIVKLIGYLGVRRGEALGLKWDDIDHKTMTITFHAQFTPGTDNQWRYVPWLKGQESLPEQDRRPLVVDIPPKLVPVLGKAARGFARGDEWVFPALDGKTPRYHNLSRTFTKLGQRLGYSRFSPHDLRHSVLSQLAPYANGDERVLVDAANHTDRRTTERYLHDLRMQETRRSAVTELRKAAGLGY